MEIYPEIQFYLIGIIAGALVYLCYKVATVDDEDSEIKQRIDNLDRKYFELRSEQISLGMKVCKQEEEMQKNDKSSFDVPTPGIYVLSQVHQLQEEVEHIRKNCVMKTCSHNCKKHCQESK